jgi:hypothetical protein
VPAALESLVSESEHVLDAARSRDWATASAALGPLDSAWNAFRTGKTPVPQRLGVELKDAVRAATEAVGARRPGAAGDAALRAAVAGLDLQLRYRPPAEVDTARFALWTHQLEADARVRDARAVRGDVASLRWIRDRLRLRASAARTLDNGLRYLEAATAAGEFRAVAAAAGRLQHVVPGARPLLTR